LTPCLTASGLHWKSDALLHTILGWFIMASRMSVKIVSRSRLRRHKVTTQLYRFLPL
jgi:hypothetical protein